MTDPDRVPPRMAMPIGNQVFAANRQPHLGQDLPTYCCRRRIGISASWRTDDCHQLPSEVREFLER
ncbi:hypothetical protein M514_12283 [Trichuris suis]|uniref:Uncharacterized protein n=1 Tax=Trichuris suis TaxID=68888 RepID=A0A085N697_9BILA|nr:hypothetical protein M513_12283 [Trichuris suis]KFD64993.1 hypothetical protein M514_12283 [Trichuris suis]